MAYMNLIACMCVCVSVCAPQTSNFKNVPIKQNVDEIYAQCARMLTICIHKHSRTVWTQKNIVCYRFESVHVPISLLMKRKIKSKIIWNAFKLKHQNESTSNMIITILARIAHILICEYFHFFCCETQKPKQNTQKMKNNAEFVQFAFWVCDMLEPVKNAYVKNSLSYNTLITRIRHYKHHCIGKKQQTSQSTPTHNKVEATNARCLLYYIG